MTYVVTCIDVCPVAGTHRHGAVARMAVTQSSTTTAQCKGTIAISHLAFAPPSVVAGGTSTAHLSALNCTGTSQQAEVTWFGRFTGGIGLPKGCPAIDPLPQGASFKAHGSFQGHVAYTVPSTCTAKGLQVTARISQAATVLATKTAVLEITP